MKRVREKEILLKQQKDNYKEPKKKNGFRIILKNLAIGSVAIGILYAILLLLSNVKFFGQYNNLIRDVFYVALVAVSAFFISKIAGEYLSKEIKTIRKIERTPILINKVIYIIGFITASLIIFGHFDIALTPILTALGIAGIALGLALQPTLSNFFAGLIILSEKSIEVGDHLEIDKMSGYIQDISWRSTTIRTLPNNIVVIPNSKIIDSIMTNHWAEDKAMAVLVEVGVDYKSDLERVEKITIDVAKHIQKNVEGAVEDFIPFIRYHTFADSNINFTVILRAKEYVNKYLVTHEFIKALKKRYDKEGIEISWPIRKVSNMK